LLHYIQSQAIHAQAIESFLMQKTTFPFEVLRHDDASTDATAPAFIECSDGRVVVIAATSSFHDSDAAETSVLI
jgi:hypothetical protein